MVYSADPDQMASDDIPWFSRKMVNVLRTLDTLLKTVYITMKPVDQDPHNFHTKDESILL